MLLHFHTRYAEEYISHSRFIKTFNNFYHRLKKGGFYIIEDVTSYRRKFLLPLFIKKFECRYEINHTNIDTDPEYHGIIIIKKI